METPCAGSPARSKAAGSRSALVGVRRFESGPAHQRPAAPSNLVPAPLFYPASNFFETRISERLCRAEFTQLFQRLCTSILDMLFFALQGCHQRLQRRLGVPLFAECPRRVPPDIRGFIAFQRFNEWLDGSRVAFPVPAQGYGSVSSNAGGIVSPHYPDQRLYRSGISGRNSLRLPQGLGRVRTDDPEGVTQELYQPIDIAPDAQFLRVGPAEQHVPDCSQHALPIRSILAI